GRRCRSTAISRSGWLGLTRALGNCRGGDWLHWDARHHGWHRQVDGADEWSYGLGSAGSTAVKPTLAFLAACGVVLRGGTRPGVLVNPLGLGHVDDHAHWSGCAPVREATRRLRRGGVGAFRRFALRRPLTQGRLALSRPAPQQQAGCAEEERKRNLH